MNKIHIISDNIITPLGFDSDVNFNNILNGNSSIKQHHILKYQEEPFFASLIDNAEIEKAWMELNIKDDYTRFEKLAILSVYYASRKININLAASDTLFIVSTTKGNISLIDPEFPNSFDKERVYLWKSASLIAEFFGNKNRPSLISSACISGVSAIITAKKLLENGCYKNIVVCGAEEISRFIFAGFSSLKALSPLPCRPYDKEHCGLNLGEGAATLIFTADDNFRNEKTVSLLAGTTSNDANHISGPSRTGEGLYQSLMRTLQGFNYDNLAFVNAHGTATVFNDDMEACALSRSGLSDVLTNSFKGYYGHTLGAAGVIESVLSMKALQTGILPASFGFKEIGTPDPVNVNKDNRKISGNCCVKTASGFGGCNASILLSI